VPDDHGKQEKKEAGAMNKIIMPLLVIVAVAAAVYFFGFKESSDPLSEAIKLEVTGDYSHAMTLYITALIGMTDARSLPSKAQSMATASGVWIKELDKYLSWLISAKPVPSRSLPTVTEAIDRCGKHVENYNTIAELRDKKATLGDYQKEWNAIFYPAGKAPPEAQETLIEKAIDTSISIVTLTGNANYRYEGWMVNRATGKRMDFSVYNDGRFSLLAAPGSYYLLVTGTVTFPSGQTWMSPASVLSVTLPDSTLLLSIKLKTDVRRR
jgi:hypothetical protein